MYCSLTSTESTPLYGFLIWYYQFIRAESYISIAFFFFIMFTIVVLWWCSSYRHEQEYFELFTVVFPNESIEWWYDWMIENILGATYLIYACFNDLYYFWTPTLPSLFVGRSRTNFPEYTIGLRRHNFVSKFFSSRFHYKGPGYPGDYSSLEEWILNEWTTIRTGRFTLTRYTSNGAGFYLYLNRRTRIGEKLKHFFFITLSQAMNRRSRYKGYPSALFWRTTDPIAKVKTSKYVRYETFLDRKASKYIFKKFLKHRVNNFKFRKRSVAWDRRIQLMKRKRWLLRMIFYFNRYIGNSRRLNGDINSTHIGPGRGLEFVKYHFYVRKYKNLVPFQRLVQRLIFRRRRKETVNMVHFWRYGVWKDRILRDRPILQQFFFNKIRPKWHRAYFKHYWKNVPDEAGRGVDYTHYAGNSWKIWPYFIALALLNGFSWEEDEIEMYEEEFEDWYIDFDITSGELNYGSYDYGEDPDINSLVVEETEEHAARHHAASIQADKDDESATRDYYYVIKESTTEDDIVNDPDLDLLSIDMYGKIFEYYEDPVYNALEHVNMHMTQGYDMPPAWGRLHYAGAFTRTFIDRIDNLIYAFFNHGYVSVETGRAAHDRWWDGERKSWKFDGTPIRTLVGMGGQLLVMLEWYTDDYCQKKKEFDPDVYAKMQEMDREIRKKRPHYHGMAIWRGYGGYKKGINPYNLEEAKEILSPEEYEELVQYDLDVTRRELREEFIHPDEYRRKFPHHRKVIRRDPKTL